MNIFTPGLSASIEVDGKEDQAYTVQRCCADPMTVECRIASQPAKMSMSSLLFDYTTRR